jgi:hypothetical protein
MKTDNSHRILANRTQFLIGLSTLVLGFLVYLIYRPAEKTYFLQIITINITLFNTIPDLFNPISYNLPSFFHVFSFILITASFLFCSKKGYLVICLCWFLVDFIFELGQYFYSFIPLRIPFWFEAYPFLECTDNYFLEGRFDPFDLFAIILGTVTAYFTLIATRKRK